jgi:uncharacterized protein YoxC
MVRVTFCLQLLLLVLILNQTDAVNKHCREIEKEISSLKKDLEGTTEQRNQYETFFGQCKVSTCA